MSKRKLTVPEQMPNIKTRKPRRKRKKISFSSICLFASVVLIIVIGLLISGTIKKGKETAAEAYNKAKEKAKEDTYNSFYNMAFTSAEHHYHVSNRALIEVEAVKEEAQLEVLRVFDVEYVVDPEIIEDSGAQIWVEYGGEGVFAVDMKQCEFIIDNDHEYVLARVPKPKLIRCKITQQTPLLLKEGLFNKSTSEGVDFANSMYKIGDAQLNSYIKSNPKFYSAAKKSAQTIISDLIMSLNPDLPNLTVDVDFVE